MEKGKDVFGEEVRIFNAIVQRAKKIGTGQDFFRRLAFVNGALEAAVAAVDDFEVPDKPASLKTARKILGRDKVISAAHVMEIWKQCMLDKRTSIRYNESTLHECAEENQHGHDWRLLYVFGRTLRELADMGFGADIDLFADDWWTVKEEAFWADDVTVKRSVGSYLLIDFSPVSSQLSLLDAENKAYVGAEILDADIWLHPCSVGLFAEALVTVWQHNREELAQTWKHWGCCVTYPDQTRAHIFVSMDGGDRGICVSKEKAVANEERSINIANFRRWDF